MKALRRLGQLPIILFLLLVSLGLNGYYFWENRKDMTVVSVHDGDTFTLGDGQRVKLLGANAPELGKCGADHAQKLLARTVMGKTVQLTDEKRDTYGRRMGIVWVGNEIVNETILREGWARPDYTPSSQNETLKAAYKSASDNGRGIHSDLCKKTDPAPPNKTCVIKGNIDKGTWDHFYHLPSCRHYKQIVLDLDMGEGYYCTEDEAKEAGFTLAPDCLR